MESLVTVGIPTYNRPALLGRALSSVASQSHPSIEVMVADNGSADPSVDLVVASFKTVLPGLRYVRHEENIGAVGNFMYLLAAANGDYFMWLADDDEVSENYIASLVEILGTDRSVACAAGHWMVKDDSGDGRLVPTPSYPERHAVRQSSAFRLAIRRHLLLRSTPNADACATADFRGYLPPNRGVLWNWAHVYLLDVVLRGRVLIARDPTVLFINHSYEPKTYDVPRRSVTQIAIRALRRINVHLLYWEKCARWLNPLVMPLVVGTSIVSLIHEGLIRTPKHSLQRIARSRTARKTSA